MDRNNSNNFSKYILLLITVSCFGLIFEPYHVEAQGNMLNIRQILKRDFNLDLNIEGGDGKRNAPIIVLDKELAAASLTVIQVLRGLGRGRGILWREQEKNLVDVEGKQIEQLKIETKEASDSKVVTQIENYYFDITASGRHATPLSQATISLPSSNGIIPFSFSWLHYAGIDNNEPEHPGYGVSVAYSAPGMKGTIYIYDNRMSQIPADINDRIVIGEFSNAKNDIVKVHSDAKPHGPEYVSKVIRAQLFDVNGEKSLVALGVHGKKFFKVRISNVDDPILNTAVTQCIKEIELFLSI